MERTPEQKHKIELSVTKALSVESVTLWNEDNKAGAKAILDYLAVADGDSLVRFYDVITQTKW